MEKVILVNEEDGVLGTIPKLAAHQMGKLHRAVSVFIFNAKQEWLLQKRNSSKYHSGGLWSNTCCGHPRLGESHEQAALRKLKEEMGISCTLSYAFSERYYLPLSNGLIENEIDHVYFGWTDQTPEPNPEEAEDWKYVNPSVFDDPVIKEKEEFTSWFRLLLPLVKTHLAESTYPLSR